MFVYVMSEEGKKKLEQRGFELIKTDKRNGVWVFENKNLDTLNFELDCPCVVSDVLTF